MEYKFESYSASPSYKKTYLAFQNEKLIGFVELELDGHIDCVYVHPNFHNQGVGSELLNFILKRAKELELKRLFIEASIVAKALFKKHGFVLIKGNKIKRGSVVLVNFTLECIL